MLSLFVIISASTLVLVIYPLRCCPNIPPIYTLEDDVSFVMLFVPITFMLVIEEPVAYPAITPTFILAVVFCAFTFTLFMVKFFTVAELIVPNIPTFCAEDSIFRLLIV